MPECASEARVAERPFLPLLNGASMATSLAPFLFFVQSSLSTVAENTAIKSPLLVGRLVTTFMPKNTVYTLEGSDSELFTLLRSGSSYSLFLKPGVALDYEAQQSMNVAIRATQPGKPNEAVYSSYSLRVTDVAEAPVITSNGGGDTATVRMGGGQTAVTQVQAQDPDAGAKLSYSIVGGANRNLFTIDAQTGQLSFKSAPATKAGTQVFDVIVQVSDAGSAPPAGGGGVMPLTDRQQIRVEIKNSAPTVDQGPFNITDNSFSFRASDVDGDQISIWYQGQQQAAVRNEDGSYTVVVHPNAGEAAISWGDVTISDGFSSTQLTHVLRGSDSDEFIYAYTDHTLMYGFSGDDSLIAVSNNTTVLGGAGNDFIANLGTHNVLRGGIGNDSYLLRSTDDLASVIEEANEGHDTVIFEESGSITALDNVEHYVLLSSGSDTITFNSADSLRVNQSVDLSSSGNDTVVIVPNTYMAGTSNAVKIIGFTAAGGTERDVLKLFGDRPMTFFLSTASPINYEGTVGGEYAKYVTLLLNAAASETDIGDGGAVEQVIAARMESIIFYSPNSTQIFGISNGEGGTAFYEARLDSGATSTGDFVPENFSVQHVATLVGVAPELLSEANFS